ncbi:MAG: hypothetical protein US94_C0041G0006 [Berkelbacteria bacterium GW2011_GWB1_38_5]|uniref:DUF5615 domain-containing protein n=2 Tax=Candidatus Berkelbacteria TaxID=1618330 RepID=A0A0G0IQ24_9BACT|nr:MAG: hypothetical protein US31_C0010G0010 [Berkelbacteria bacterium GW2011_GWA1_36_9]KKQ72684.1 MAG: hypothetical protein US94_C0041G0006 [Berkelbacteria bacterium GW2011_GWB1_38_5]
MSPKINKFRFCLDENFPAPAGKFLRKLGHNVKFVIRDNNLRSLSDYKLLEFANKEKRIFLALDKDFRCNESLHNIITNGSGVILILSSDPVTQKVERIIQKWIECFSKNTLQGKLWILSIDKKKIKDFSKT